jgi:CTP:molybdopterin cytidylyltransferase MocA
MVLSLDSSIMQDHPILLLAAGQSSRMRGADKLMADVDGQPLLRRQARAGIETGHPVYVVLPSEPHPRYDVLEDLPVTRVPAPLAHEGINASLIAGLCALPSAPSVMILLADLPDIGSAEIQAVFAEAAQNPNHRVWRGATQDGKPGHPVLIDNALIPKVLALKGDQGAQAALAGEPMCLVPLPGRAARNDLDTPEDWDRWRQNRVGNASGELSPK